MSGGRRRAGTPLVVLAAALLATTTPAAAQVTTLRPLNFGTILTGTTTSVAPTAPGAAAWRIHGILGVAGGFTLTLPATLTRTDGRATMPVTFCATCAVYRVNNALPAGGTSFDPSAGVQALTVVVVSDIYVWLGGAVSPPLGQPPGSYTGTVVLTVAALL